MSKRLLFIAFALVLFGLTLTSTAFAQTTTDNVAGPSVAGPSVAGTTERYDHGLYVNPFWLLLRGFGVGYEHRITNRASLMVGVVGMAPYVDVDGQQVAVQSVNVHAQPHYYLGKRGAMRGPYVAPFVSIGYSRARLDDVRGSGLAAGAGATLGWSFMIGPANLKLGLGGAYRSSAAVAKDSSGNVSSARDSGFGLAGDLKMGFQF